MTTNTPSHIAYWTAEQICERLGGITKRTLNRYIQNLGFPQPINNRLQKKLFLITAVVEWEQNLNETETTLSRD